MTNEDENYDRENGGNRQSKGLEHFYRVTVTNCHVIVKCHILF